MNNLIGVIAALVMLFGANNSLAQEAPIPFISINIVEEGAEEAFETYLEDLTPIISTHNSGFAAMDVSVDIAGQLQGNMVVSIGQFGSQSDAAAFNQDPDFLTIFPDLEDALQEHLVFFPDGPIPTSEQLSREGSYLLTFVWSDTSNEDLHAYNEMVNGELETVLARHGGTLISTWQALAANQGLGDGMEPIDPPQLMELWHFDDLRGFFTDPDSQDAPQPEFAITKRFFLQITAR